VGHPAWRSCPGLLPSFSVVRGSRETIYLT
jgi:hypothetical protein